MKRMTKTEFYKKLKKIELKNEQIELRNRLKLEKKKYKSKREAVKTSNVVLTFSIIAIVSFTIACLFIQYHIEAEVSSTLITLWFSFWTVEILALTGIKVSKIFRNHESAANVGGEISDDEAVG